MGKRCLIIYSSITGHTEKVALRIKQTFEKNGWETDCYKIRRRAEDILNPPFDIHTYDFVCIGSGLIAHLPYNEILNLLRHLRNGMDPRTTILPRGETISYIKGPIPPRPPLDHLLQHHGKIVFGPKSGKAIIFITYAGCEFGPKEAEPASKLLALEIEHVGFECIGHFCCPGKYVDHPTPKWYHGDIRDRPNEKDLLRAELFIEDRLEEIADRTA